MTMQDYCIELRNEGFFDAIHYGMYWTNTFRAGTVFDEVIFEADRNDIDLTSVEDFDYENFFYEQYKTDQDKGLS